MAAATAESQPQQSSAGPFPYTFPTRVLSIPLVSSGIDTVHSTLLNSPYTKNVYLTSQSIALSAYGKATHLAAPIYPRVQPVLVTADGYATKGFDLVEAKFPLPFHSTVDDLKQAPAHAREIAKKTIDEKITTPAYGLATSVDSRLAPLVDLLEQFLVKAHVKETSVPSSDDPSSPSTSSSSSVSDKAQITRAKELLIDAKDRVITITTEQAKAIQSQNVYIQRASEHAKNVNATLAAQYANAQAGAAAYKGKGIELQHQFQERVHTLSQNMITELEKIQATTASLPQQLQTTLQPYTTALSATLTDLQTIIKKDVPLGDKAKELGGVVQAKVGPIIENAKGVYQGIVDRYVTKKDTAVEEVKANGIH